MVYRLEPAMRPDQYRTFQVTAPLATHWAPASCEEFDCQAWLESLDRTGQTGVVIEDGRLAGTPAPVDAEF